MPGTTRRSKPLKGSTLLADVSGVTITNAADDDLLAYDLATSVWVNTKSLTGDYTITGTLTVNNITLGAALTVGTDLTVTNDLSVGGDASVTQTLTVAGASTLASATITGAATVGSTLGVTGTLTGSAFSFSGNGTITGTLGVTGATTLGTTTTAGLTASSLTVSGASLFSDVVTLSDDLNVSGNLSGQAIAGTSISSSGDFAGSGDLYTKQFELTNTAGAIKMYWTNVASTLTFTGRATGTPPTDQNLLVLDPDVGVQCVLALEIDGDLNHDGSNIGFFGTAPTTQATAYTQTYATADKTHAAETTADISLTYTSNDPAITPDGSITIADGAAPTTNEYLEWLEELTDQQIKQRADVADLKQLVNSIIDDLQAYGLFQ